MDQMNDYTIKDNITLENTTSETEYQGKLLVSEETIAQIAAMALKRVDGVVKIVTSAADEFQSMIGSDKIRGIKVEVGEKEAIVDLNLCVLFDIDVPSVAKQVRQMVAHDVYAMTGIRVIEININIGEISDGNVKNDVQDTLFVEDDDDFEISFDDIEPIDVPGTITFSEYVPAAIAGRATMSVPGVARMNKGIAGELAGFFSDRSYAYGVKVEMGRREMIIDLFVDITFGERIPDVSWTVQEKVKECVEKFTGLNVKEVNVSVQGIHFDDE